VGYWPRRIKLSEDLIEEEIRFRAALGTVVSDLLYMVYVGTNIVPPSSFIATATVEDFINNRTIAVLGARAINRMMSKGDPVTLDLYASLRYYILRSSEIPCKIFSPIDRSFSVLCDAITLHRGEILAHALHDILDPLASAVRLAGAKRMGDLLNLLAKFLLGKLPDDEYRKLERIFESSLLPNLIKL